MQCEQCHRKARLHQGLCPPCLLVLSQQAGQSAIAVGQAYLSEFERFDLERESRLESLIKAQNEWVQGYEAWKGELYGCISSEYENVNRLKQQIDRLSAQAEDNAKLMAQVDKARSRASLPHFENGALQFQIAQLREANQRLEQTVREEENGLLFEVQKLDTKVVIIEQQLQVSIGRQNYSVCLREQAGAGRTHELLRGLLVHGRDPVAFLVWLRHYAQQGGS